MKARGLKLGASASALAMVFLGGMTANSWANDDVMALQHDPAQVVTPTLTYNGWNFSELDQINRDNVGDLQLAWSLQLGVLDQYEAPPLVIGDTMYIVSPKPNQVLALDLSNEGSIIWEYRPEMNTDEARRLGCCGAQTRGLYYAEGKIFFNTLDGQVFGLDAETGEVLWHNIAGDLSIGETTTAAGLVIGDLFIVGNEGGERGIRGKITAFDINTGNLQWTMYSMGPNNEVGIGDRFQPFYPGDQVENPALDTWYGDSWRRGGGTVWGYFVYDPDLNMFYYGTGNCGPWNPDYRRERGVLNLDENGGMTDYPNNYCASLLARDGTTGELIWAYNMTPADPWDFDEPGTQQLVDLEINGETRHALIKAGRNGLFYIWDRATGELLNNPWPFRYINWALPDANGNYVNPETGRPNYNVDVWAFTDAEDRQRYTEAGHLTDEQIAQLDDPDEYTGTEITICPSINARNWMPDTYSPRTGLLYVTTTTGCGTQVVTEGEFTPGEGYTLRRGAGPADPPRTDMNGDATDVVNNLIAIDPATNEIAWSVPYTVAVHTPVFGTAGDLLFRINSATGRFVAMDADNGEVLWSFRTGGTGNMSPITYIGPDGRQYVAVINSSSPNTPQVAANAAPDAAARYRRAGSTLFVFALPETETASAGQ